MLWHIAALLVLKSGLGLNLDSQDDLALIRKERSAKKVQMEVTPEPKATVLLEQQVDAMEMQEIEAMRHTNAVHAAHTHTQKHTVMNQGQPCTLPAGMKWRPRSHTTHGIVPKLSNHQPFTFLRIGDGGLGCAATAAGINSISADSNGDNYKKETAMCEELRQDLKSAWSRSDANFFLEVGTFFLCEETHQSLHKQVERFFRENPIHESFSGFLDSEFYFPLLPPVQPGRQPGVLPLLDGQTVVLVGPLHLGKLKTMLQYTEHIVLSDNFAWDSRDSTLSAIATESAKHPSKTVVFLVAGGVSAEVLLYRTFMTLGQKDTFIDVGASLDQFAGVASRDYNQDFKKGCSQYPEYFADGVCAAHGVQVSSSAAAS